MQATIIDLRYHMKDILHALDRNESVEILYHGKTKGIIIPVSQSKEISVTDHPYFGIAKQNKKSVEKTINKLRGNRYDNI